MKVHACIFGAHGLPKELIFDGDYSLQNSANHFFACYAIERHLLGHTLRTRVHHAK